MRIIRKRRYGKAAHSLLYKKNEDVIYKALNEIKQAILDLKILMYTSDVGLDCRI